MFRKKKAKRDLVEILLDRTINYEKRSQAALDISEKKEARFLNPLIYALNNDPEPSVRMNAAFALGELNMKAAKSPLLKALSEDGSEWVRGFTATALANLGLEKSEIEDTLIEMLTTDRDAGARRHYTHSLGQIGSIKSGSILISMLQDDPDEGVRADAAEALGIIGFEDAYSIIIDASENDVSYEVRQKAIISKEKLDLIRN